MTEMDGDGLGWLDELRDFEAERSGKAPDLQSLTRLLDCIGDPQSDYRSIHIAGTNGKGGVAHFASVLAARGGSSVGTYLSPDLGDLCERIQVNLAQISRERLNLELLSLRRISEAFGICGLTKFEALTAVALAVFSLEGVELGVIEVGMGGAWDATNVVHADVAVISSVGLDHQEYLGSTVEEIAKVKAGIIKPDSVVVVGAVSESVESVIADVAERSGAAALYRVGRELCVREQAMAVGGWLCDLQTPFGYYSDLFVAGHGRHHVQNALIALGALEAIEQGPLPPEVVQDSLRHQALSGRLEVVRRDPLVVVDVAHNTEAAQAVAEALAEEFAKTAGWVVVLGLARGRESTEFLRAMNPSTIDALYVVQAPGSRDDLVDIAHGASLLGIRSHLASDVESALNQILGMVRADQGVLVLGGHGIAGEALEFLRRTSS
jgi:dihydrofolate synthase/folylpolyglutamate synthase